MEAARFIPKTTLALFWRVKGNTSNVQAAAYYLEYIGLHMPVPKIQPALEWLIRNELTGDRFLQFVAGDCAKSGLELIRHLTMRLERETKPRALFAKDMQ